MDLCRNSQDIACSSTLFSGAIVAKVGTGLAPLFLLNILQLHLLPDSDHHMYTISIPSFGYLLHVLYYRILVCVCLSFLRSS